MSVVSLAYGGGLNSVGLLIGMKERNLRPDVITMSDTGAEKPETYEHVVIMQQWCLDNGFPPIVVVKKNSIYKDLEDNCLKKNMLPSLAYGFKSCSDKYKRQPQEKYLNHLEMCRDAWKSGEKVIRIIGYDAGETRRAKIPEDKKYVYRYLLLEWGWYREDCISACNRAGIPVPPKSACFFCPASKKKEVIQLAQIHPMLFARAVEMERNARESFKVIKGLGRHWSWEELVKQDEEQRRMLVEPPQIECMCYDGQEDDDEELPIAA